MSAQRGELSQDWPDVQHPTHPVLAAAVLALAAPAAADTLAPYDGGPVAQRAGVQVWSQAQGKDRYVLMVRSGGQIAPVPVAAQRVPFAVSLGAGAHGRALAVYPRCTRVDGFYRAGCRLVAYDVAARTERPIAGTHAPGASEEAVALDHGTLAFARRTGKRSAVLIRRLGSRRPARLAATVRGESYVTGLALSRAALAVSVDAFPTDVGESRLYVKPAGRPVRQVARGGFGEENRREHESPSIAGRYLYWAYANQSEVASANGWVARCDLRTGTTTAAAAPGYLDAVAADARQPSAPLLVTSFSQTTDQTEGVDQVTTLDEPSWQPAPGALALKRGGPCRR